MSKKTNAQMQVEIDSLQELLRREARALQAYREWHICESIGHSESFLDVEIDGARTLRVVVHGISRASGGVAVVISDAYHDFPVFLDDLISEWQRDSAREIRDAAHVLRESRETFLREAIET